MFQAAQFARSASLPGLYFKKNPELVCVVRGDDFATFGDDEALGYLEEVL